METIDKAKEIGKQAINTYFSDTPKWAKIVRFTGIILTAVGASLLQTNPITAPIGLAVLIPYANYIVYGGTLASLIAQGFQKKN